MKFNVHIDPVGSPTYTISNAEEWEFAGGLLKIKCTGGIMHYLMPGYFKGFVSEPVRESSKQKATKK